MHGPLRRITPLIARHALGSALTVAVATGLLGAGAGAAFAARSPATAARPANTPATIGTLPSAAQPAGTRPGSVRGRRLHRTRRLARLVALVAQRTGQTAAAVRSGLAAGRSLDDLAGAQTQTVKDTAIAAVQSRLEALVNSAKITTAQEATRLAALKQNLDRLMAAPGGRPTARHGKATPVPSPAPAPKA